MTKKTKMLARHTIDFMTNDRTHHVVVRVDGRRVYSGTDWGTAIEFVRTNVLEAADRAMVKNPALNPTGVKPVDEMDLISPIDHLEPSLDEISDEDMEMLLDQLFNGNVVETNNVPA